jgi:RND family efflux transporter MFP subunit
MSRFHALVIALTASLFGDGGAWAGTEVLDSTPAQAATVAASTGFDGVVEALRQTVVAAQVSGAIVNLDVKVGDRVKSGQVLLRIDARAAERGTAVGDAQATAARAALENATQEYARQKQLYEKSYISRAALERAESTFKATRAQLAAQDAQAGAARIESGLHVIRAPFGGVVAEVPVALGDMAMPGRALLTLFDPSAMRVTVAVPQSIATRIDAGASPRIELPGLPESRRWAAPGAIQTLPTVDAATHTVQLRIELSPGAQGLAPGMFARVWLPVAADAAPSPFVPVTAIVRRAEMTGLYVLDPSGRPTLRQVRLGRVQGSTVEILSGLNLGERVATDPQAAARARDPR